VVAFDGKTVRGSKDGPNTALHMVSAYATELGVSLGQEGTAGKGNELVAIKALLDTLVLKGCIVTMDALGCQTDVAERVVAQGGDYVLAVRTPEAPIAGHRRVFATAEAFEFRYIDVQKRVGSKRIMADSKRDGRLSSPTYPGWTSRCARTGRSWPPSA